MRSHGISPPGLRLPDETRVGAAHLQIGNLQSSIDYYEQVLGLRVLERTTDKAALGARGISDPLVWLHAKDRLRPAPRRGAFGLYHFAILLPDRAALGRFVTHVSRVGQRVGMADHLVSEALYLTDPDGLGIEVYADRPRSAWHHRGRELAMTTDPLDVQDLIEAGRGRDWDGAPEGATMGHVHLHVGNLEKAEAFYHAALGFDKTVWTYPGALFFSAGGYHHHLGTNTWSPGPAAAEDQARLLEWQLVLPNSDQVSAAARNLRAAGHPVEDADGGWKTADPWGTPLRVIADLHSPESQRKRR